eukprot:12815731-Ditylum_brightwellii.AAC.1
MYHGCKERYCESKKVQFHSNKTKLQKISSDKKKDLNMIMNKKIAAAFCCHEKKEKADLNKVEALSILSASDTGDSDSKPRVGSTSKEGTDSEWE